ncbi:MAG TPA: hypothetical protein VNY05_33790 [Candidatus Acidoferrales bacterium]|nr:hypothetical protein [Candidatus Acidoferrales bacterium]
MPRTKSKPVSAQQLAANRANAAQSTGPRSPEGKANSAQNARKHGFTASTFAVVRLEDVNEIAHLRDDAVAVYQPVNSQELFAVERIALAQQSMLRAARLESGIFTTCLNETVDQRDRPMVLMAPEMVDGDMEITRAQNRNYCLTEGFHSIARKSNAIGLFLRYQAQAERQFRRAVEEFDRLKALRPELPNEPIFEPQPEPTQPTCPSSETNPMSPEIPISPSDLPAPPPEPATGHRPPATGIRSKSPGPGPWPRSEPPVRPPLCKNCNIVICRR